MIGLYTAGAGALIGALSSWGSSDQEIAAEEMQKKLRENEEYFKSLPFSKDEIMGELLPQVQKMYRGSADLVASKSGAAVGESGASGGQGFAELYATTLAPVVAQGENMAAGAVSEFGQWFSNLDAQGKDRFQRALGLEINNNQSLPSMTDLQKIVSGAGMGANIGGQIGGSLDMLNANLGKLDSIDNRFQTVQQQIAKVTDPTIPIQNITDYSAYGTTPKNNNNFYNAGAPNGG